MGAAGLTCSAVEMGAKGDLGVELDLDKVPCREEGMTAYEMMLSESQERMLMVLKPGMEDEAEAIFRKWGLDFAVIGKTTDTLRFVVKHGGEIDGRPADQGARRRGAALRPAAPRQHLPSPTIAPHERRPRRSRTPRRCCSSSARPTCRSKRWVWEQYDHLILGNTVQTPGGDAAIVRVDDGPKGLALTTDVTPRYCEADPVEGGKQAVAEAWRNITAVGGRPLAVTDNLNFGNPERPEVMGQLVGCIRGIGEACRALDFPVVSGNVSLYNETNGQGILPTPTIGGVGVLDDVTRARHARLQARGRRDHAHRRAPRAGSASRSTCARFCGREEGAPPPVDLAAEKRNGDFVRQLIRSGQVDTVHDCSDGGLALALAEMAMAGGIGAAITGMPDDAAAPRLPVRRGPGPLRDRRRPRPGDRHPLRGQGARACRRWCSA